MGLLVKDGTLAGSGDKEIPNVATLNKEDNSFKSYTSYTLHSFCNNMEVDILFHI